MPDIASSLLTAVRDQSHLRARRAAALQSKRQAQADHEHYLKHILPELERLREANALLDATHRAGCLHDEIRVERVAAKDASAHINALTKTQVLDRIYAMADALRAEGNGRLGYRPGTGEAREAWWKRVDALRCKVVKLWRDNEERIREGELRYVEGLPVRDVLRPPRLEPHLKRDVETGLGVCEGCEGAGVRCSRVFGFAGEEKRKCVRCRRLGRECVGIEDGKRTRRAVDLDVIGGELVEVDMKGFALPVWWDEERK